MTRLQRSERFFRQFARRSQAVTPFQGLGDPALFSPQDGRQPEHPARLCRGCRVRPEAFIAVAVCGVAHDRIDRVNHRQAAAPGVVAGKHVAAKYVTHESLRGNKNLRLSAAKAVNALFGVANNENAGRVCSTRPCPTITAEPA